MKPIVFYHSGCLDGLAAAWCFWHQYKDQMEYIPARYQETDPLQYDVHNNLVYIVDFSFSRENTQRLCDDAKEVILLDHHITAYENLKDFVHPNLYNHINLSKSGAILAWEHICAGLVPPTVLLHIEDNDLWRFRYKDTRAVVKALYSHEFNFETFDKLTKTVIDNLVSEGNVLIREFEKDIKLLLRNVRYMTIGGHEVPVVNANSKYSSELGNILAENNPFGATYFDTDESRIFSLRSTDEGKDVSKVAQLFGGGGHRNAAGFKVPRHHEFAMK